MSTGSWVRPVGCLHFQRARPSGVSVRFWPGRSPWMRCMLQSGDLCFCKMWQLLGGDSLQATSATSWGLWGSLHFQRVFLFSRLLLPFFSSSNLLSTCACSPSSFQHFPLFNQSRIDKIRYYKLPRKLGIIFMRLHLFHGSLNHMRMRSPWLWKVMHWKRHALGREKHRRQDSMQKGRLYGIGGGGCGR